MRVVDDIANQMSSCSFWLWDGCRRRRPTIPAPPTTWIISAPLRVPSRRSTGPILTSPFSRDRRKGRSTRADLDVRSVKPRRLDPFRLDKTFDAAWRSRHFSVCAAARRRRAASCCKSRCRTARSSPTALRLRSNDMVDGAPFCNWLASTSVSHVIQTTNWIIPTLQTIHILAIAGSFSAAILVDLRMWGVVERDLPLIDMARRFLPA